MAERERIPVYQLDHQERKDEVANDFGRKRGTRDEVVFVGHRPRAAPRPRTGVSRGGTLCGGFTD
jgi:hypothetical protein